MDIVENTDLNNGSGLFTMNYQWIFVRYMFSNFVIFDCLTTYTSKRNLIGDDKGVKQMKNKMRIQTLKTVSCIRPPLIVETDNNH